MKNSKPGLKNSKSRLVWAFFTVRLKKKLRIMESDLESKHNTEVSKVQVSNEKSMSKMLMERSSKIFIH
jgi:hypothetical protein